MKSLYCLLFAIIPGCTPLTADDDLQEVRDLIQNIIDADNRADIESVVSCYHTDARLLPPGKQEIVGAEAIKKNYETIFSTSVLNLTIKQDELVVTGDYAICIGRTHGQVLSKSDSTTRDVNDKFVMVLQKRSQHWKIKSYLELNFFK